MELAMLSDIEFASLRLPLLLGAIAGAIFGVLTSQPLRASAPIADAAATQSCRILCESATWLRAPVRYRTSGAG
jgi:hypothetical protein